jgi:uncharacterized protein YfiM (DUF2279 family)
MQLTGKSGVPKSPFSIAFGWSVADSRGNRISREGSSAISRLKDIRWDLDWTAYSQSLPSAKSASDTPAVDEPLSQPATKKEVQHNGIQIVEIDQELRSKIVAMTNELFPGPVRFEIEYDPEFPDEKWHVVEVEAHGEFRDILGRELRWHDKVWDLLGKSMGMQFRLGVIPK